MTSPAHSRVVHKQYDPKDIWNILHKYQVAYVFLPPFYAHCMISAGRPDGIDTSALYSLATGGGHLSTEKIRELRELLPGTFVSQMYGCSELCGVAVMFNLASTKDTLLMHSNPSSSGRPTPGCQYKVVNVETEDNSGPHQQGELLVKSEFSMVGYYQQDSSAAYDNEGWLCTGDIAYFDENHCFYIVDRKKEILKFRGYQVPPAVVEQILQEHPSVKQCIVIGIPHEVEGDHPMAIVVLHQSFVGRVTEEEITSFVEGRVNDFQRLRGGVKFIDVLPTSPSGKVRRKEIRDMVISGLL
ncbi:hypothetical protein HUJ05_005061 [Dendroctonus ponderosae]|nr:hypothetical protein HUJ05_005061 [Dendroctonus ponderosae]